MILDHYYFDGYNNVDVGPGLSYRPSLGMALAFAFQFYYIILDDFIGVSKRTQGGWTWRTWQSESEDAVRLCPFCPCASLFLLLLLFTATSQPTMLTSHRAPTCR
jgi:hypothetical protein